MTSRQVLFRELLTAANNAAKTSETDPTNTCLQCRSWSRTKVAFALIVVAVITTSVYVIVRYLR